MPIEGATLSNLEWDPECDIPYALVWRWLNLSVHRYGSTPTGQTLTVLTIVLLADLGYHPTVTELAEITGLPKSTISRYVSFEMSAGFLEEYIDRSDRRRRMLRPTTKAETEREWHRGQIREAYRDITGWHPGKGQMPVRVAKNLIEFLKDITAEARKQAAARPD